MKRTVFCLVLTTLAMIAATLNAKPTARTTHQRNSTKTQKSGGQNTTRNALAESANGWTYVKGEWVHPEGYKLVNGKVLRTTAKTGKAFPKPPGKLALENPQMLAPQNNSAPTTLAPKNTQSAVEKAAEIRQRNLTPTAAPQTGTHL
jgi:hypothetical protein